jgi:uncharacterized membrane protein YeaQ/YmgE (transglycosylase-associated protein family)
MTRIILGAIAGFIVWAILWVGSDALMAAISPGWYGQSLIDFQAAIENKTAYTVDSIILIMALIRSVIFSIVAGFVAASIAKESSRAPLLAGVLLLLFGIFIQSIYWNYVPLWYHIPFLLLLVPVTLFGGKLKRQKLF